MDSSIAVEEYLASYQKLKKQISQLDAELALLRQSPDSMNQYRELHQKVRQLSMSCLEIDRQIDRLPAPEKTILRYRYILGYPWEDVRRRVGCSADQLMIVHQNALSLLSEHLQ